MHFVNSLQYFPLSFISQVPQTPSNPVARSTSPSPSVNHVGSGSSSVGRRNTLTRERSSSLFHSTSNANASSSSNSNSNFSSLNFLNPSVITVSIPSQDTPVDSTKTSHCLSLVTLVCLFALFIM